MRCDQGWKKIYDCPGHPSNQKFPNNFPIYVMGIGETENCIVLYVENKEFTVMFHIIKTSWGLS